VIGLLQLTARHKSAAPVNRQLGDDMIIAGSVFDEEARQRYPEGWTAPAVLNPIGRVFYASQPTDTGVQIGGSARGYQAIFVPSTALASPGY
jgi:phage tail tape-measure protein